MSEGFKHTWDDEEGEEKVEPFFYWALVTNNTDPEKRGRVRGAIFGLTSGESTWMEPIAMPGAGGSKHGGWFIPKVGATILVGFVQGDIDSPFYFAGPYPSNQAPDNTGPNDIVWQSDDFRISFTEQVGNKKLRLETILADFLPVGLASKTLVAGTFKGVVAPGNIDLTTRPKHKNADGSISTVKSLSLEEDGVEILIPTIADDGTALTDDQAVALYHTSGKFLGKFTSPANANVYAIALHNQQDAWLAQPTVDDLTSVVELTINSGASGKSHVINIRAPGGLNLTSQGTINIDAPVVTIKGRTVGPTDEVI